MASSILRVIGGSRRFISCHGDNPDIALDRAALEIEFQSSIIKSAEQDKIEDATSMAENFMESFIGKYTSCDEDCSIFLNEFQSYLRQTLEGSRILPVAEVYASLHAYTRFVNTFAVVLLCWTINYIVIYIIRRISGEICTSVSKMQSVNGKK